MLKFSQNPELRAFLLSTGDVSLLETASNDGAWGVANNSNDFIAKGLQPADYTPHSVNEELFTSQAGSWKGQRRKCDANSLGKCLMIVRAVLREHPDEVTDLHSALELVWDKVNRTPGCAIKGLHEAHAALKQLITADEQ